MFRMTSTMSMGRTIMYISEENKGKLHQIVIKKKLRSLDAALSLVMEVWEKQNKK